MSESRVPAALFDAIKRDLQPVRPLASPARRALALLPLGIVLLIGMPAFWAWRSHLSPLATWPSWGLSALETALSLVILAAAFREAIPGRELSTRRLVALMCLAGVAFFAVNDTARLAEPVPVQTAMHWIWDCIAMATAFSIPALVLPLWLMSRALPNRPALTGALGGLGVGLMADAGLRLLCWGGTYAHVVLAHGGAIVTLVALGALSATLVERSKARR